MMIMMMMRGDRPQFYYINIQMEIFGFVIIFRNILVHKHSTNPAKQNVTRISLISFILASYLRNLMVMIIKLYYNIETVQW